MAKKKDEFRFAKMERPAPWLDPPKKNSAAPEAAWSGRKFRRKPKIMDAVQISEPLTVETPWGPICGSVGDWLLTDDEGQQWFNTDEYFRENYEPVSDSGSAGEGGNDAV